MKLINPSDLNNDAVACSKALEAGDILFFPKTPFEIPPDDQMVLRSAAQVGGARHKNIAYRPKAGKLTGVGGDPGLIAKVRDALRRYSEAAVQFAGDLLPHYAAQWKLDYASFRGLEEDGRDLPLKKRNDLLHTDAFPSRPTNGDLILRFFSNINPVKGRKWVTSDPFAKVAAQYANQAGLPKIAGSSGSLVRLLKSAAQSAGLPVIARSPYDEFMLGFHDFLKMNEGYQRDCPKFQFEFPPFSSWMVFTDVVPHSVLSGQHALEQTFIVSKDSLFAASAAPVKILERLAGKSLL
jgi:hypothetical protein